MATKLTTKELLNLDCRREENKEIIQKALHRIPKISKTLFEGTEVPLEMIEDGIHHIIKKYKIRVQWISLNCHDNITTTIYQVSLISTKDLKWIGNVYGASIYEALAKTFLKMYALIKCGEIEVQE